MQCASAASALDWSKQSLAHKVQREARGCSVVMTQPCSYGDVERAKQVRLMGDLCSTLEDRRSSSSMAGEQMLRKILQIQVLG